jgi:hypothetical protein
MVRLVREGKCQVPWLSLRSRWVGGQSGAVHLYRAAEGTWREGSAAL